MNSIEIDRDACTACQTCYDACFVDVYRWDEKDDQPVVAYPEDCVGCNKCELECPAECIRVVVDFPGISWPEVV